nr:MerR family transcriptional regulator [Frankia sp. R43]
MSRCPLGAGGGHDQPDRRNPAEHPGGRGAGRRGRGLLIGDVARCSGVNTRMLRHYDALGLVRPNGRTVGGYREYSAEDIRRIFHVESLRSLGLSLKQVGAVLGDPTFTPSALVSDLIRWAEDRLERERELLRRLRAIDASPPTGWQGVLRIVELSGPSAREVLRHLADDNDPAVALVAAAFVGVLEARRED